MNNFISQFSTLYNEHALGKDTVVYTAIIGDYDELKDPLIIDKDVDYVCFTDSYKIKSNIWKVIKVDYLYRDPRRTARLLKVLPHKIFNRHKINLWVDASFLIKGSIKNFCKKFYNNSLSCFPHNERDCVYEEIDDAIYKDRVKILRQQAEDYKKEGLPKNFGLISSGILLRNNLNEKVSRLMNFWANQIDLYSSRDQVSFSYCIWKLEEKYFSIPLNIFKNDYFEHINHPKFIFYGKNSKKIISIRYLISWLRYTLNNIKLRTSKLFKN
jgi:hypothetical protein